MNLPNFLIIGAPKAGTSSIYYYLKQHPQIYMSLIKEPHFFTLENQTVKFEGPGDQGRFEDAVTTFQEYCKLFEPRTTEIALGEASTTYLSSDRAPQRIKHYIPQVKLIAILRNPIDAAYSSYLHLLRDGDEEIGDFALALQAEEKRIQQNWEGLWHYKTRGFYYGQLKRYFDLFERKQLKVYLYEDFCANPLEIMRNIFQFLAVDSNFLPDLNQNYNVSARPKNLLLNQAIFKESSWKSAIKMLLPKAYRQSLSSKLKTWNYQNYEKPSMSIAVRQQLTREYTEDILKLQDLIQQDISAWLHTNFK